MTPEIFIVFVDGFPTTVKAYTKENPDSSYTILINSKISYEQQKKSYEHEMNHIINGDIDSSDNADSIEYRAHGIGENRTHTFNADLIKKKIENLQKERKRINRQMLKYDIYLKEKDMLIESIREYNPEFKG